MVYLLRAAHSHVWVWKDGLSGWGGLGIGAECRVREVAVSLDVGERFPHNLALGEEALVSHQQEQLILDKVDRLKTYTSPVLRELSF